MMGLKRIFTVMSVMLILLIGLNAFSTLHQAAENRKLSQALSDLTERVVLQGETIDSLTEVINTCLSPGSYCETRAYENARRAALDALHEVQAEQKRANSAEAKRQAAERAKVIRALEEAGRAIRAAEPPAPVPGEPAPPPLPPEVQKSVLTAVLDAVRLLAGGGGV